MRGNLEETRVPATIAADTANAAVSTRRSARTQIDLLPAGLRGGHGDLLVGKTALWTDAQHGNVLTVRHGGPQPCSHSTGRPATADTTVALGPPGWAKRWGRVAVGRADKLRPIPRRGNLHQAVAAALFRRLDDPPPQPPQGLPARPGHHRACFQAAQAGRRPTRPPSRPAISAGRPWATPRPASAVGGSSRSTSSLATRLVRLPPARPALPRRPTGGRCRRTAYPGRPAAASRGSSDGLPARRSVARSVVMGVSTK